MEASQKFDRSRDSATEDDVLPTPLSGTEIADLVQREREQRDFLENAAVPMHWVGEDGTILWANGAELKLLGYAAEEYVGQNIAKYHADEPVIQEILKRLKCDEKLEG